MGVAPRPGENKTHAVQTAPSTTSRGCHSLPGAADGPRMRRDFGVALLLLLLSAAAKSNGTSPPGTPVLLGCRSPEKETFTCRWEPGSDGGLPTTHRLYYERDRLEGAHECPDYRSAGNNSCFFDKEHTSIWVYYYLTVTACNALGNATSEPFRMDVMEIVKPDALDNVTLLLVRESEGSPHLRVAWEPPSNTDTRSGWVTVKYELRVRQDDSDEWTEYTSGTQTHFSLYSITPGRVYTVQVRCRLDHGSWSEWSNSTCVKIPNHHHNETAFWFMVSILSALPLITALLILAVKRKSVKQWVLPPVPGPKIRDIDPQLLNSGGSKDVDADLLVKRGFLSIRGWKEQMEEYLIVTENDDAPPSNSQKRNKSFLILTGFNLEKIDREETTGGFEVDAAIEPLTDGSYVETVRAVGEKPVHSGRVKEVNGENRIILGTGHADAALGGHPAEGYSRVTEVDGVNVVLVQTHSAAVATVGGEKGNHYTERSPQKTRNSCTELVQSGYVDVAHPLSHVG
ncbi:prolactin receptor b [Spinachia spinachia]